MYQRGLINYNLVLSLRQLGYPLKEKPEDQQLEELIVVEGVEDFDMVKRIRHALGKIHYIGKEEVGKHNCIALASYSDWVRSRVKSIKMPYPWEPSMSFKPNVLPIVVIFEVDKLKKNIMALEKENVDKVLVKSH